MSDANSKPDSQKTRQELLDEIYLLRDIAGEREQRAQDLRARVDDQATALAEVRGALARMLASRSWRVTAPLRIVTRWLGGRRNAPDALLQVPTAATTSGGETTSRARTPTSGDRAAAEVLPQSHDGSLPPRAGAPGEPHINPTARYPGESRDPVTLVQRAETQRRWIPDIASRFRDDEQIQSPPRLFVDITELALRHGKTGVQRVTREILRALLVSPPAGYSVVPVIASTGQPYRETVGFGLKDLRGATPLDLGPRMAGRAGDVFLGLDHSMHVVAENVDQLVAMREQGVRVWFVCNDTLPLAHPEWFPSDVHATFERWFRAIASVGTGMACISHATELDVRHWVKALGVQRAEPLAYGVFPLGSDMPVNPHEAALPPAEQAAVDQIHRLPSSFLMVGTIEPRKGHAQALEAFNQLWSDGEDVALVIAGQPGWMTEVTQRRIRHHEELGKRLFWFMDASDALLDALYSACTVLLAPSEAEGFGLPLVEAARHGLPIVCRDLPVFREVAGGEATWFTGTGSESLAIAVCSWLGAHRQKPISEAHYTQPVTWSESAEQLRCIVCAGQMESAGIAGRRE